MFKLPGLATMNRSTPKRNDKLFGQNDFLLHKISFFKADTKETCRGEFRSSFEVNYDDIKKRVFKSQSSKNTLPTRAVVPLRNCLARELLPLKLIFPPSETNPKDADVKRTFVSHEAMKHNGFNLLRAGKIQMFLVYGRYIRANDEKVIHRWLKKDSKIPVFKKKQKRRRKKQNGRQFKTGAIVIFLSFFFLTQCSFSSLLSYLAKNM